MTTATSGRTQARRLLVTEAAASEIQAWQPRPPSQWIVHYAIAQKDNEREYQGKAFYYLAEATMFAETVRRAGGVVSGPDKF